MDIITKYLNNIAYKFPKGYPDMDDPKDKAMLNEIMKNLIKEDEEKKLTKKDLINLINDLDCLIEPKIFLLIVLLKKH